MIQVVVTELEYRKARGVFEAAAAEGIRCVSGPAAEAELAAFVREQQAQHAIVGVEKYTGLLYEALPAGAVLARFGIGHDGVDKTLATARGIYCTNTPGALDDSVAEHAVNLLLAAARHTVRVGAAVQAGQWGPIVGAELAGKTLAIIGCGPIGKRVAQIAAFGLRMKVVGCEVADCDIVQMRREFGFYHITRDYAEAVAAADFVSLHIPSVAATHHFMNADRLAAMPNRAWLVNTARGAVVDEAALFDAMAGGTIAGAALDVFEHEPYAPVAADKDLRMRENIVMTPHVGSSTQEACDRMARRALCNIQLAEAGKFDELDLLNRDLLAT